MSHSFFFNFINECHNFFPHFAGDEILGTSDDSGIDNMALHFKPITTASNVSKREIFWTLSLISDDHFRHIYDMILW